MPRSSSDDSYGFDKSLSRLSSFSSQRSPNSKLKLSCDICAKLKVKCPKQLPSCERCLIKGMQCRYSSSRRHNKRIRKNKSKMGAHVCTFFLPSAEQPLSLPWQNTQFIGNVGGNDCHSQRPLTDDYSNSFQASAVNTDAFPALPMLADVLPPPISTLGVGWPSEDDVLPSIETKDINMYADTCTESPCSVGYSDISHAACLSSDSWVKAPPTIPLSHSSTLTDCSDWSSGSSIQDDDYTASGGFQNALQNTNHLPQLLPETPQETFFDLQSTYYEA